MKTFNLLTILILCVSFKALSREPETVSSNWFSTTYLDHENAIGKLDSIVVEVNDDGYEKAIVVLDYSADFSRVSARTFENLENGYPRLEDSTMSKYENGKLAERESYSVGFGSMNFQYGFENEFNSFDRISKITGYSNLYDTGKELSYIAKLNYIDDTVLQSVVKEYFVEYEPLSDSVSYVFNTEGRIVQKETFTELGNRLITSTYDKETWEYNSDGTLSRHEVYKTNYDDELFFFGYDSIVYLPNGLKVRYWIGNEGNVYGTDSSAMVMEAIDSIYFYENGQVKSISYNSHQGGDTLAFSAVRNYDYASQYEQSEVLIPHYIWGLEYNKTYPTSYISTEGENGMPDIEYSVYYSSIDETGNIHGGSWSTSELSAEELKVYPNPCRDILSLPSETERFQIFKLSGELLIEGTGSTVVTSEYEPGAYFVVAYVNDKMLRSRFIKI